jgi:hypothetical protein
MTVAGLISRENWAIENPDEDAYIVGGLGGSWFLNPDSEHEGGTAQVSWEFEPDPPFPSVTATKPNQWAEALHPLPVTGEGWGEGVPLTLPTVRTLFSCLPAKGEAQ